LRNAVVLSYKTAFEKQRFKLYLNSNTVSYCIIIHGGQKKQATIVNHH